MDNHASISYQQDILSIELTKIYYSCCRDLGPKSSLSILYIGPMAQAKDKRLSKEEKSSSEETMLVNKEVSFGHNSSREWVKDKCILG